MGRRAPPAGQPRFERPRGNPRDQCECARRRRRRRPQRCLRRRIADLLDQQRRRDIPSRHEDGRNRPPHQSAGRQGRQPGDDALPGRHAGWLAGLLYDGSRSHPERQQRRRRPLRLRARHKRSGRTRMQAHRSHADERAAKAPPCRASCPASRRTARPSTSSPTACSPKARPRAAAGTRPATATCNLYMRRVGRGNRRVGRAALHRRTSRMRTRRLGRMLRPQNLGRLTAAASPSGRYLAFMSARSLTGYDNRDAVERRTRSRRSTATTPTQTTAQAN